MQSRLFKILFLCTGNSARSILAEAVLNQRGAGRLQAHSAGSLPKGAVHPLALETLVQHGYAVTGLRSKSWNEFVEPQAPVLDLVVTVCDNAAHEVCPVWLGTPVRVHWGMPDPAAEIALSAQRLAFVRTLQCLEQRVAALLALPLGVVETASLQLALHAISRL